MKTAVADDQPKPGVKMTEEQLKQKIKPNQRAQSSHYLLLSSVFPIVSLFKGL